MRTPEDFEVGKHVRLSSDGLACLRGWLHRPPSNELVQLYSKTIFTITRQQSISDDDPGDMVICVEPDLSKDFRYRDSSDPWFSAIFWEPIGPLEQLAMEAE